MKHSIKRQIAGIFIALMTGTIGMCLLINQLFLERIYIKHKENAILSAFTSINEATTNGDISSDDFDKERSVEYGKIVRNLHLLGDK